MHDRILVTGGAGFVAPACVSHSRNAIRVQPSSRSITSTARGSELNLDRLRACGVSFVHGDIRCPEDLFSAAAPDLIVECSAEPSAQAGYGASPRYLMNSNLVGCFNCLELARGTKADFVFISTSRVYPYRLLNRLAFIEEQTRYRLDSNQSIRGASRHGVSEAFPLEGARSLYGMTKLASELMVEEYADAYGFRFLIDRSGLITGPRQMAKADQGVLALWMAAHYFRRPIQYIGFGGEGKQVRDFLHIDDFCDLLLEQIGNFDQYDGQTFNVGGGVAGSLSLLECMLLCEEITGNSISISKSPEDRSADVRIYITDCSKLFGVSGWRPKRDAKATLADIHDWLRAEESALKAIFAAV